MKDKKITISAYNPFDYLETQEEVRDFLQDALNDEDPRVFINALSHWVKYHGIADVAQSTGLNRESLYKTVNGVTNPRWKTVHKIFIFLKKSYAL